MNREIKFRAWDTNQKQWVGIEVLYLGGLGQELEVEAKRSGIKIMQSTGLLDKNGKEIYEGDIITQHKLRAENFGEITGEIIWYEDYAGFAIAILSDDGKERFVTHLDKSIELEVIGNTYEERITLS